jgi:hypothetical protein
MFFIYLLSFVLINLPGAPVTSVELPMRLLRLAFLVLIRWLPWDLLRLTLPEAVIFTLLLKPLWVFCFGI